MTATLADVHHAIVTCERCPRLRSYCQTVALVKRRAFRKDTYWGRPVPGFGDSQARLLLVALAPAAHGANRTGRVFTGDGAGGSGDFLMSALHRTGFANIPTSSHVEDGLKLDDAFITAAVRCAPPDNMPLPDERERCIEHLEAEFAHLPNIRVVIALGKIAFDTWRQLLRRQGVGVGSPFSHGVVVTPGALSPLLMGCYHPSRQNTNTGRLTADMMETVLRNARTAIERQSPG
jgi:uracil-DNA glycosylase family 4